MRDLVEITVDGEQKFLGMDKVRAVSVGPPLLLDHALVRDYSAVNLEEKNPLHAVLDLAKPEGANAYASSLNISRIELRQPVNLGPLHAIQFYRILEKR